MGPLSHSSPLGRPQGSRGLLTARRVVNVVVVTGQGAAAGWEAFGSHLPCPLPSPGKPVLPEGLGRHSSVKEPVNSSPFYLPASQVSYYSTGKREEYRAV